MPDSPSAVAIIAIVAIISAFAALVLSARKISAARSIGRRYWPDAVTLVLSTIALLHNLLFYGFGLILLIGSAGQ